MGNFKANDLSTEKRITADTCENNKEQMRRMIYSNKKTKQNMKSEMPTVRSRYNISRSVFSSFAGFQNSLDIKVHWLLHLCIWKLMRNNEVSMHLEIQKNSHVSILLFRGQKIHTFSGTFCFINQGNLTSLHHKSMWVTCVLHWSQMNWQNT